MGLWNGNGTQALTHLIPQGHEVVCKNESLADDHPFGVPEPLVQQVSQVRDVARRVGGQVNQV